MRSLLQEHLGDTASLLLLLSITIKQEAGPSLSAGHSNL